MRHGANLEITTLEQSRETLDDTATLSDTLTGGRGDSVTVNGRQRHVASYLKDFLFQPEQLRSPVSALSGGERARLMLARALARPSNVLVLDEPTNDLDLETLDLLQELVSDYPGTVLLVSHDRDFLDRTATSLVTLDPAGRWREYAGGYTDMLAQRGPLVSGGMPSQPSGKAAAREARTADEKPVSPARNAPARARKLSFKEKHALETLPARIEELEARIATLGQTLSDPALFARDPNAFTAASEALSRAEREKAEAEERWLELELLREELEG